VGVIECARHRRARPEVMPLAPLRPRMPAPAAPPRRAGSAPAWEWE